MIIQINKVVPIRDQVIIKVERKDQHKGLIIPSENKESRDPAIGLVISVGDGKTEEEKVHISVKPGDRVIYSSWSSTELNKLIEADSEDKYLVIGYKDIVAKIEGGN